jgi:peptidyl-tRNA hydrolase
MQVDHVLGTFDPDTKDMVVTATYKAADAIEMIIRNDFETAMNKFNGDGEASKAH